MSAAYARHANTRGDQIREAPLQLAVANGMVCLQFAEVASHASSCQNSLLICRVLLVTLLMHMNSF